MTSLTFVQFGCDFCSDALK